MKTYHESQNLDYKGTIIDIETIGDFKKGFPKYDSREFNGIQIVIFGYINSKDLFIFCAEGVEDISQLESTIKPWVKDYPISKPLYAYNCHHEMGVIFHHLGIEVTFDYELQFKEYQRKEEWMQQLGLTETFNDPFHYMLKPGLQCRFAWQNNEFDKAIQHNRACLLKEQSIMLKNKSIPVLPFNFSNDLTPTMSNAFQPWSENDKIKIVDMWNSGKSISCISQESKRTSRAIWMQLQKQRLIPYKYIYTTDNDNRTKFSLG